MEADLADLIGRTYEAALIPERWPDVIARLTEVADAFCGLLFSLTDGVGQWVSSDRGREAVQAFFEEGWVAKNVRAERLVAGGHMGFSADHEVFTAEELENLPIYRDFLRPRGLGYATATHIPVPNGDRMVLSLERTIASGPVDRSTIARLDLIRPHLARAALLAARVGLEKQQARIETLGALGIPAAVVHRGGIIGATNSPFEALEGPIVNRAFGRLGLRSTNLDELFAHAIETIEADDAPSIRTIPVPADAGTPPFVLHVVPIRRDARDLFARSAAVVVVSLVKAPERPDLAVLQGLYDLTAAEARVGADLLTGASIADIARRAGVSRETIRTQVKSLLAKTGVARQQDFISRMSGVI